MKKRVSRQDRVRETRSDYGSARTVSATEAARNLSELMNRVKYRGESFKIERGGEVICELRPAGIPAFSGADFVDLMHSLPPVDEEYLDLVVELGRSQPQMPDSAWEP